MKILSVNDCARSRVVQASFPLAVFLLLITACAPSSSLPHDSSQTRSSLVSLMPGNNVWKVPIDSLPVDSHSANYIRSIGADKGMHLDFGSGAIFDLTKNDTRPVGWTSADAAGLPIME